MIKKLLKLAGSIILALFVLCLGAFYAVYHKFNHFEFEDPYPVIDKNLGYFTNDYSAARLAFRNHTSVLKIKYPNVQTSQIPVQNSENLGLTIDVCYIPAVRESNTLLLISSGTHGIEGHVGSAIQSMFMDQYLNEELLDQCGVLLIHAINPYGFHHNRRVTEENIDLNRNCSLQPDLYSLRNPGYTMIDSFINPLGKLDPDGLKMKLFFVRAINQVRMHSMDSLRQAILQGQYAYPDGIFYGGQKMEPQIPPLMDVVRDISESYDKIIAIDLHTGYGARGTLHLLSDPVESKFANTIDDFFGDFQIDYGDDEDFYSTTGEFVGLITELMHDKPCIPITFEYGTMDSQTTLGSLKSLQIMVAENQARHFGCDHENDYGVINSLFLDMFYPKSGAWRSNAVEQTRLVLDEIIPKL